MFRDYARRRREARQLTFPAAVALVTAAGSAALYQYGFGTSPVAGFLAALASGAAAYAIACVLRPDPVPDELAEEVAKLEHRGWRRARIHPRWHRSCAESASCPHVHMVTDYRKAAAVQWKGAIDICWDLRTGRYS